MRAPSGEDTSVEDFSAQMREYLASLPADRFPNTTALAAEITASGADERFDFALDVLVEGLVAVSKRRR
jgi:hypothetical protein